MVNRTAAVAGRWIGAIERFNYTDPPATVADLNGSWSRF